MIPRRILKRTDHLLLEVKIDRKQQGDSLGGNNYCDDVTNADACCKLDLV